MATETFIAPHGGELVDLLVDAERAALLKKLSLNLPDITLSARQSCDFELLATGAFSPLKGFMKRPDYESVLDRMRLQDNTLWPLPICLDISREHGPLIGGGTVRRDSRPRGISFGHPECRRSMAG